LTEPDAARSLIVADHLMRLEPHDDFTTALVGIFDPVRRTLVCASAGHPGPLVWSPDGTVIDPFVRRSLPLGLGSIAERPQTAESIDVTGGSFATFFTDGLVEWNHDFIAGMATLSSAMHTRTVRESETPASAIREFVLDSHPHRDDIAILTMRVNASVA
jgi:serine phosphatase RsbU (regulator of sigma subunit)